MSVIDALQAAERECKEWIRCNPAENLRSIGTVFSEIHAPSESSTDVGNKKYTYRVAAYMQVFSHRQGDKAYYNLHEEIRCIDIEEVEQE